MKKRGISNVVRLMLFILMVIILVALLWFIIRFFIKIEGEKTEARASLLIEDINIRDFGPIPNEDGTQTYSIILERGPSKEVLVSREVVVTIEARNADIISVTDLSTSMRGKCTGYLQDPYNKYPDPIPDNLCAFAPATKERCDYCKGIWDEGPLGKAEDANNALIDNILAVQKNQIGLVGYKTTSADSNKFFHQLSTDSASLKNQISTWDAISGTTCICCGINKAVSELLTDRSQNENRVMIIMSDGAANQKCSEQDTLNPKQDAIKAAKDAFDNHQIKSYTIGFKHDNSGAFDEATLIEIAKAGGGEYAFAEIGDLPKTYSKISKSILSQYAPALKINHIKIIFYNDISSYEYRTEIIPKPLESYKYKVEIPPNAIQGEIKGVKVYMSIITPSGKEVISPLLDNKITE